MPKSKRDKKISLTRTKKKGLESKQQLVQEIRNALDEYAFIYIFSVQNMRNSAVSDVRTKWRHSRFFFGKNKVMAIALGRTAEEERYDNVHKIAEKLRGQCGLIFSNKSEDEVLKWFDEYACPDFARSGDAALNTVTLLSGPLPQFHFSLEPHLRQLGLPTSLQKNVVTLLSDHTVCKNEEILKPEQARILKLMGHKMATVHFTIECMWSNNGTFKDYERGSLPARGVSSSFDIICKEQEDSTEKAN